MQNDASKIVRNSSWLTIGNSYATREDYKRDLEKVYKFVKKLPSIEVYDDFESAMEKVKTLKQAEIEVNEHEITENRWYIVRLNENIEKLEAELRVPDADRDGITEKLMKYGNAISTIKKWIDELQAENERLAEEEGVELKSEICTNDDEFYLPEMYRKKANDK